MKQILSKSIVLIGLMGSGKSVIGRMLSDKIGVPLSETDRIIEKEVGKKVYQIFDDCGERYFRKVEEEVVGRVLDNSPHIISTGGGSILSSKTRKAIKSKSFSIWVQCDLNIISNRILYQEKRPLLKSEKIVDILIEKNKERIKFYTQADSKTVNENPNLEITVEDIVKDLLLNRVLYKK